LSVSFFISEKSQRC